MIARRIWSYSLVLDRRFWEERPAFVTLFTPRYGIVDVRLEWKRRGRKSPVGEQAALEPMALSWFEIILSPYGTEALSWESVRVFPRLRETSPSALLQMAFLIHEAIPPLEPVSSVFGLALKSLLRSELQRYPLLPWFCSGLLRLLGYGIEELVGGRSELRWMLRDSPQEVMLVCDKVLNEVVGVRPWIA